MTINGNRLILLPLEDTKANYLSGFWKWVEHLANGNYSLAIESLYWREAPRWTPEKLEECISRFFAGDDPWVPIIPNRRLVEVVNDAAEYQPRNSDGWGWLRAQIPVTNKPQNPKDDNIPLMGMATSFFLLEYNGRYALNFEIFHL